MRRVILAGVGVGSFGETEVVGERFTGAVVAAFDHPLP
jgi:hypothetical protein